MLSAPAALLSGGAQAADATWNGATADYNTTTNWSTGSVPGSGDVATFDSSGANKSVTFSSTSNTVGGWTFNSGAYDFTTSSPYFSHITFDGAGIVVNGGASASLNLIAVIFENSSSAGSATINGIDDLFFYNSSTAGSATITNAFGGFLFFNDNSKAGSADITNNGYTYFKDSATADNATITNSVDLQFLSTSTAGSATITNKSGGDVAFFGSATADNATITNNLGGTLRFGVSGYSDHSTAGSANILNDGSMDFYSDTKAGSAQIQNLGVGTLDFYGNSTADSATIENTSSLSFHDSSTAGNATITSQGGTIQFDDNSSGGTARFILNFDFAIGPGTLDLSQYGGSGTTVGSIEGDGDVVLGSKNLAVGGNNLSTTFSGVISGTNGSLTKEGTGTLTLSGANTYTGGTTITGGLIDFNSAGNFGTGTITLDGGGLQWASGTNTDISSRLAALGAGGASFDTNGNDVTLASVLSGTGALTKEGAGTLTLSGANAYTGTTTVNGGILALSGSLASGQITINSGSEMDYLGTSTAGSAAITDDHVLNFYDSSTAGSATINILYGSLFNQDRANFNDTSSAGSATITNDGNLGFSNSATADNATITNTHTVLFVDSSTAGNATITNNQVLTFDNGSTAGRATITNAGNLDFFDSSKAGSATITNNSGFLAFWTKSTAGSATITTNSGASTVINQTASGGTASFILNGTGALDISGLTNGGTTAGSIEGDGDVFLGGNNLAVGATNLDATFSGVIRDGAFGGGGATGGSLTKDGTGDLTLSGTNTYSGGTTINAGTVTVGNDNALSTGDVTMAAGTTLAFSGDHTIANNFGLTGDPTFFVDTGNTSTITGVLSDTNPSTNPGVVEKTGDGTLILSAVNTYSGGTIINAGTLLAQNASALGTGSVTVESSGAASGSLVLAPTGSGTPTYSNALVLNGTGGGNGALHIDTSNAVALLDGLVSLGSDTTIVTNGSNIAQFSQTIGGTNTNLTLTANSPTIINKNIDLGTGTLTTNGANNLALNGSVDSTLAGVVVQSGVLQLGYSGGVDNKALPASATLTVNGGQVLVLRNETIGALGGTGGTIDIDSAYNLSVGNDNGSSNYAGGVMGTGSLTKEGTGNLILSGTNSYTGATIVNAGTLSVNGSIASSSSLTVNAGGTIGGNGDLPSSTIASGGILAPGNSIGTVTVNGNLTLAPGSAYNVQVSPSAADETIVTGNATLDGTLTTSFAGGSYTPGTQYTLINAGGSLSGTFAGTATVNLPYSYAARFSYDAHNAILTLSPVVDPKGGQIYANRTTTDIADERMIRDAVLGHLVTPADAASADGIRVWGQGFTGYGKFDNAAITHNHGGGIAGVDLGLDGGVRLGLAGAYLTSSTSISATMGRASGDSGHVIAYGDWRDGNIALRGGASYGWGSSDVTRIVPSFSETDRASQPGRTAQLFAEAGYSIHADGGILEPHAGLAWVHAEADAFKEAGAFASFTGAGTSASATFATLGIRAILPEIPIGSIRVTPRFDLGWQHGFGLTTPRQSLSINNPLSLLPNASGTTAIISGVPMDSDAATAEVGADVDMTQNLTLHVGYDGLMAGGSSDNTVTARLGWRF